MSNVERPINAAYVIDHTQPKNVQANIPAETYFAFDKLAKRRGWAKSVMLKYIVAAIVAKPALVDVILGKPKKP